MTDLKSLHSSEEIAIYQKPDPELPKNVRIFVTSSPETRAIINDSLVYGIDYTEKLKTGLKHFFLAYQNLWPFQLQESESQVLSFLRGGLNFGIREALAEAYDWNSHASSFLSSQRSVDSDGHWYIKASGSSIVDGTSLERKNNIFFL